MPRRLKPRLAQAKDMVGSHFTQVLEGTVSAPDSMNVSLYQTGTLKDVDVLSQSRLQECVGLVLDNMSEMHQQSGWHLTFKGKLHELGQDGMVFLIATIDRPSSEPAPLCGFLCGLLDIESDSVVFYCYEVHVKPEYRGRGVGKHLLKLAIEMARSVQVDKIMATVFLINKPSQHLFRNLGFTDDKTDPQKCGETATYNILSLETKP